MRDPDIRGSYGAAWERRRGPVTKDQQEGLVGSWIVDFRGFVVGAREWFAISVVHLRHPSAMHVYKEAEYELQMVPVRKYTDPDGAGFKLAGEPELMAQFNGDLIGDQAARAIARIVAETSIKGGIPPKQAALNGWREVIGTIMKERIKGKIVWF